MLQKFRKLTDNKAFKAMLILLAISFALTGVSAGFMADFRDNYVVKVGDEKIYPSQVESAYSNMVASIRAQLGGAVADEQIAALGVTPAAITGRLAVESQLRQEANDFGLRISDEAILEQIKADPLFQKNGQFSTESFRFILYRQGMTEAGYFDHLREKLSANMLLSSITSFNPIPAEVTDDYINGQRERRDVLVVTIPDNYKKVRSNPSKKQLEDYFFENSFNFQIPEKRKVSYIKFGGEDDAADYELSVKVEDGLAGGATMAEVAKANDLKLVEKEFDGDESGYSADFINAVFAAEQGEPSSVIEDDDGKYLVFEISEVEESRIPELSEVKKKVTKEWQKYRTAEKSREFAEKFFDEAKNRGRLKQVAAKYGLRTKKLKTVAAADYLEHGFDLVNASFGAEKGEVVGVFTNEDGDYQVAKVGKISEEKVSDTEIEEFKIKLGDVVSNEYLQQYLAYLEQKYPVTQNPNAPQLGE